MESQNIMADGIVVQTNGQPIDLALIQFMALLKDKCAFARLEAKALESSTEGYSAWMVELETTDLNLAANFEILGLAVGIYSFEQLIGLKWRVEFLLAVEQAATVCIRAKN